MSRKLRGWILFLIALNGYVSLSLELVVMRQLGFYVGSSAVVSSIIIGTFLGFMSLGYFRGSSARVANARRTLFFSFIIIAIMAILASSWTLITQYFQAMWAMKIFSNVSQTFLYSLLFLSAGPFLFGFNTALLSRFLQKRDIGKIMAWDTIGSVAGSLAATLLLMPIIGVNWTIILIVFLSLVGAVIAKPKWRAALVAAAILVPAVWINTGWFLRARHGVLVNNANNTIIVQRFGDVRVLNMNGISMSIYNAKTRAGAPYIDYINENFIYNMPRDKMRNILVLGAGGFTLGVNDTFNEYTFVDIEHTLKDVSENYFLGEKISGNKRFIVADASQYLKNTDKKYDMILLDIYSNAYSIPENFITAEFMARLKSRVADGGIILMNVICSGSFSDTYSTVFDNTFHAVFDNNTSRQVLGAPNPWNGTDDTTNVVYIYYNRADTDRIYTINKTPVIYDK
jgi:predicted membrane-bound spermidine synthase